MSRPTIDYCTRVSLSLTLASILRKFNHEGIQVCHKLIKTKHNLYIVYGLTEGESMQKALAGHIDFKTSKNNNNIEIRIVKQLSNVYRDGGTGINWKCIEK